MEVFEKWADKVMLNQIKVDPNKTIPWYEISRLGIIYSSKGLQYCQAKTISWRVVFYVAVVVNKLCSVFVVNAAVATRSRSEYNQN